MRGCGDGIGPDAHTQATGFESGFDADWKEAQDLIAGHRSDERIGRLKREQLGQTDVVERDTRGFHACTRGGECIGGTLQVSRGCGIARILRGHTRRGGQAPQCRVVRRFGGGHFSDRWLKTGRVHVQASRRMRREACKNARNGR